MKHRVLGHRDRRFAGVRQPIVRGISGWIRSSWGVILCPGEHEDGSPRPQESLRLSLGSHAIVRNEVRQMRVRGAGAPDVDFRRMRVHGARAPDADPRVRPPPQLRLPPG
jgi:hypothetical protein